MSSKPARESQGRAAENSGLTPTPCRPPPRARHSCHFHLQHAAPRTYLLRARDYEAAQQRLWSR